MGFRTIQELRCQHKILSKRVQSDFERFKYGLAYYEDLTEEKIAREEANFIFEKLKSLILENVGNECLTELMGGFRRLLHWYS